MNKWNTELFRASDGGRITASDIFSALQSVGAHECDALFVQTDISFGQLSRDIRRQELLQLLSEVLFALKVPTLLFPTFTFSFPNHQTYDVLNSKTSMGALIEYMRKLPEASYRTLDPLLSITVMGKNAELFYHLPHNSLGPGSSFDVIHHMSNAKFLMFGGEFGESFTYVHHVEKMLDVPYRYEQIFTGTVIGYDGVSRTETWSLHTACGGIVPRNFYYFEEYLTDAGYMKKTKLGDSKIVCVSERDVYREIKNMILQNPYYFLEHPYTAEDLIHEYKYGKNGEPVTHC